MGKKRLVGYLRVSSSGQDEDRQGKLITKWVENRLDMELILPFFKDKLSGTIKSTDRPGFLELKSFIEDKSNNVYGVIIDEMSRIGRNLSDSYDTIKYLVDKKINLIIRDKDMFLLDENGKLKPETELVINMLAMFASMERTLIAERNTTGRLKAIKYLGHFGGGLNINYGYKIVNKKYEIDENERQNVIDIFNKVVIDKWGCKKIANWLNDNNIHTKKRDLKTKSRTTISIWSSSTISHLLNSTIYYGHRVYNTYEVNENGEKGIKETYTTKVPPIVSEDIWLAAQNQLKLNTKNSGRNNNVHYYYLKNKIVCGSCGLNYFGKRNKKINQYICLSKTKKNKCDNKSINIEFIENIVYSVLKNNQFIADIIRKNNDNSENKIEIERIRQDIINLEKEIEKNEKLIEKKRLEFENDIIDLPTLTNEKGKIKKHIKHLIKTISNKKKRITYLNQLIETIEDINTIIKDIQKYPGLIKQVFEDLVGNVILTHIKHNKDIDMFENNFSKTHKQEDYFYLSIKLINWDFPIDIFTGRHRKEYYICNSEMTLNSKTKTISYGRPNAQIKGLSQSKHHATMINTVSYIPIVSAKIETIPPREK